MLLKKIIKNLSIGNQKINIEGLSLDSRQVKKNYLFFVTKGAQYNGEDYIFSAIQNGARAVVCEIGCKIKNIKIPIIKVKSIKKTITEACKVFYQAKPKNIIAVTGTNGKSSVAEFYYQILSAQKIPVASMGTLGIKINNKVTRTNLTTLDIISLHRELEKIKKLGIDNVILEASSHGLDQGRLDGLNFKTAIFTNFSQDHLDYHKNMKHYLNAKLILFSKLLKNNYIITDNNSSNWAVVSQYFFFPVGKSDLPLGFGVVWSNRVDIEACLVLIIVLYLIISCRELHFASLFSVAALSIYPKLSRYLENPGLFGYLSVPISARRVPAFMHTQAQLYLQQRFHLSENAVIEAPAAASAQITPQQRCTPPPRRHGRLRTQHVERRPGWR